MMKRTRKVEIFSLVVCGKKSTAEEKGNKTAESNKQTVLRSVS